jgi:hypothetical protein
MRGLPWYSGKSLIIREAARLMSPLNRGVPLQNRSLDRSRERPEEYVSRAPMALDRTGFFCYRPV